MPRSRARPHKRKSVVSIKVKAKPKKIAKPQFFEKSALDYDPARSQFDNYNRLNLLVDANQIGAELNELRGFKPRVKVPKTATSSSVSVHPLELEAPQAEKTYRPVPKGERDVLKKLIEKHGDNFSAMARDIRLNQYQHTAAHLRHRIQKMSAEDLEDAQALQAAEEAGAPAPASRLRPPKTRKNPNRAFKNRSMHFN